MVSQALAWQFWSQINNWIAPRLSLQHQIGFTVYYPNIFYSRTDSFARLSTDTVEKSKSLIAISAC